MFIILKLVGVITWSWWLVLAPTIVPVGFVIVVWLIAVVVAVAIDLLRKPSRRY